MSNLKRNLTAVQKELKALTKKTQDIIKALDKPDKPKAPAKKPVKKAPVKRGAVLTDSEKVFRIIKRNKNGVNVAALRTRTGFNAKKISNIVHRALTQGKLKRVDKGKYAAV